MKASFYLICFGLLVSVNCAAQLKKETITLSGHQNLNPVNVSMSEEVYLGKKSLKVVGKSNTDLEQFVKIKNLNFSNGTIELDMAGSPGEDAFAEARGFVGIAFRIPEDNSKFECIYLRPTNGRAEDQVRRNHAVQYSSFPDFPWSRLRKDFPEKYETYVDLSPGKWMKVKIVVNGDTAKLYVHGSPQPTLIVNDLKLGADNTGSIGLWIGPGTVAHFANLKVEQSQQ